MSTYLHGVIDCVYLSCLMHILSEFTLWNCVNINEFVARNKRGIWNFSDCNGICSHNHLVLKRTLNHSAKLTKWLSCIVIFCDYELNGYGFESCCSQLNFRYHPYPELLRWCLRNSKAKIHWIWVKVFKNGPSIN